MEKIDKDELVKEIKAVFEDTFYPGDNLIVHYSPYAEQYPDYEGNTVLAVFKGKKWQELKRDEKLVYNYGAFLTDEARRYYLPTCMLLVLEDPETADVLIDLMFSYLVDKEMDVSEFSEVQKKCIDNFVTYLKRTYPN